MAADLVKFLAERNPKIQTDIEKIDERKNVP